MSLRSVCPICEFEPAQVSDSGVSVAVRCPVCGSVDLAFRLDAMLREERAHGLSDERRMLLGQISVALRHTPSPPLLTPENFEAFAATAPQWSVDTQLRGLLEIVAARAPKGKQTSLDVQALRSLVPSITASSVEEVRLLLDNLIEAGQLRGVWAAGAYGPLSVTVDGWRALEPAAGVVTNRCFVAMWFSSQMDAAYETGFARAINDCGLEPRRIDKLQLDGKICDSILAEIRHAEIVIADFTGFRSGVFFEAGFALALGKMVVFTCRSDDFAELAKHFDTRQYQHIEWKDASDLRAKLADHIRARREARAPR